VVFSRQVKKRSLLLLYLLIPTVALKINGVQGFALTTFPVFVASQLHGAYCPDLGFLCCTDLLLLCMIPDWGHSILIGPSTDAAVFWLLTDLSRPQEPFKCIRVTESQGGLLVEPEVRKSVCVWHSHFHFTFGPSRLQDQHKLTKISCTVADKSLANAHLPQHTNDRTNNQTQTHTGTQTHRHRHIDTQTQRHTDLQRPRNWQSFSARFVPYRGKFFLQQRRIRTMSSSSSSSISCLPGRTQTRSFRGVVHTR